LRGRTRHFEQAARALHEGVSFGLWCARASRRVARRRKPRAFRAGRRAHTRISATAPTDRGARARARSSAADASGGRRTRDRAGVAARRAPRSAFANSEAPARLPSTSPRSRRRGLRTSAQSRMAGDGRVVLAARAARSGRRCKCRGGGRRGARRDGGSTRPVLRRTSCAGGARARRAREPAAPTPSARCGSARRLAFPRRGVGRRRPHDIAHTAAAADAPSGSPISWRGRQRAAGERWTISSAPRMRETWVAALVIRGVLAVRHAVCGRAGDPRGCVVPQEVTERHARACARRVAFGVRPGRAPVAACIGRARGITVPRRARATPAPARPGRNVRPPGRRRRLRASNVRPGGIVPKLPARARAVACRRAADRVRRPADAAHRPRGARRAALDRGAGSGHRGRLARAWLARCRAIARPEPTACACRSRSRGRRRRLLPRAPRAGRGSRGRRGRTHRCRNESRSAHASLAPCASRAPCTAAASRHRIASLCRRPGLVATTATHIDVTLPLEAVDLRLRRGGLDRDPGWIPWFGRIVAFHYADADVLEWRTDDG